MKIEKPHSSHLKASPVDHNRKVSSSSLQNSKSLDSSPGNIQNITSHLKKLMSTLNSPQLMKIKILSDVLPPLRELLNLMGKSSLEPFDGDTLLMEKFLHSWLKKYGDFLPAKEKKDLLEFLNLMSSRKLETLEEVNSRTIYSFTSGQQDEDLRWKIDYRNKRNPASGEDEKTIDCVFELESENLGIVRTSITEVNNKKICQFISRKKKTALKIRESLSLFNDQLRKRGLIIDRIMVSSFSGIEQKRKRNGKKGIDLWG